MKCRTGLSALEFGSQGHGGAVDRQDHERRGRAESSARYAVMASPCAILVLNAIDVFADRPVPFFPFLASLDRQGVANIHVTQELFAAIGAEPLDKSIIPEFLYNGGSCLRQVFPVSLDPVQGQLRLFALRFIPRGLEFGTNIPLAPSVGIFRILHGCEIAGAGI